MNHSELPHMAGAVDDGTINIIVVIIIIIIITHSHGSASVGDEASQWKRPKFDPSQHQNP